MMRERTNVFIATFSEDAVRVIRQYGLQIELNTTCISENLDPENRDRALAEMRRDIAASGASHAILHGPFTEVIPASIDHRAVALSRERLQEAYDMASALGIRRMVAHTGYVPLLYFWEWHLERSVDFWRAFLADKPSDLRLYIENVFEERPQEMGDLIDAVGDSRLQICLDVGHANVTTAPEYTVEDWIRILGPRIGHVHLHNNDGHSDQHAPLTEGTLEMERILQALDASCGPAVTMTIESRTCADSAAWLAARCGR